MAQCRIEHDDNVIDIIDKVNAALHSVGVQLEDDNQTHDGWIILNVVKTEYKKGQRVKSLERLMSDDRELGIEDECPIVEIGTIGTILGKSEDFLEDDNTLKSPDCYTVDWGVANYDTHVSEMELA